MSESIFDCYWHQVQQELGAAPSKTLAIRLSGNPLKSFDGAKTIKRLSESLTCDGWKTQVGTNWNWDTTSHYTTNSPEVKLEREIVKAGSNLWARQMATSSGIQGPRLNKRRAIDLVCKHDDAHYTFVELKIESDNPLFALFELLGYGLAYLHAKAHGWKGTGDHEVLKAKSLGLVILAPAAWYQFKSGSSEYRFDLDWLTAELNRGLKSFTKGRPSIKLAFKTFAYHKKSILKATEDILHVASTWGNAADKEKSSAQLNQATRQVVIAIEASGLDPSEGHRVIELAAVEIQNGKITGRAMHSYINPKRDIDLAAQAVHGLTEEFLEQAPEFGEVAKHFLGFIDGAELLAHNVPFHVGFLNSELKHLGLKPIEAYCANVVDTLQLAKSQRPGMKNGLNVLCKDLKIKKPRNRLIGAELDANLIASVYLRLKSA